jgi:hypothetical protein
MKLKREGRSPPVELPSSNVDPTLFHFRPETAYSDGDFHDCVQPREEPAPSLQRITTMNVNPLLYNHVFTSLIVITNFFFSMFKIYRIFSEELKNYALQYFPQLMIRGPQLFCVFMMLVSKL